MAESGLKQQIANLPTANVVRRFESYRERYIYHILTFESDILTDWNSNRLAVNIMRYSSIGRATGFDPVCYWFKPSYRSLCSIRLTG